MVRYPFSQSFRFEFATTSWSEWNRIFKNFQKGGNLTWYSQIVDNYFMMFTTTFKIKKKHSMICDEKGLFFVLLFYLPIDEVEFLRNRLPISEYKLSNTFCISTTLIKSPEASLTETCHNYQKYRLFFSLKIGTVWEVYNCHDKFSKKFQFTDGNMILKFLLVSKQKYQNSLCCLQLYLLFELDWAWFASL